jgi:glutathione peroxidase
MKPLLTLILGTALSSSAMAKESSCPEFLDHEFERLHSDKIVNACSLQGKKATLFVNTASHCGFTRQFEGLEALHKKYSDKGLKVVGFASDSFDQEAENEAEAASICFENFGVSFSMISPSPVKGAEANPVFKHLADQTQEPAWNFNKYLMTSDGKITHFPSQVEPLDSDLEQKVKAALN